MKRTPPATEPIVFECDLAHSPELVWRALTERDLLGAWLLPNDIRPEVGARFSFKESDARPGSAHPGSNSHPASNPKPSDPVECEVLEVEPNRTLRWRQTEDLDGDSGWRSVSSVVTIELTENAVGGTRLRLVHDEFTIVDTVCQLRRAA
jgi:uncharacterized protein YndB with AHSA1/START domain